MRTYEVTFTGIVFGKEKTFVDTVKCTTEGEAIQLVKSQNELLSNLVIRFIELV